MEEKVRKEGVLSRACEAFGRWANRWVPGAMVLVLILTVIVAVLSLLLCKVPFFFSNESQVSVVDAWVKGFWSLLTFSMQMCIIMISGDVLANAPIVKKGLTKIARLPKSQLSAVVILAVVVFITRWIHWGFGMMVGYVLGKQMLAQAKQRGLKLHKVSMAAICYCITCATIGISTSGPLYVAGSGWLANYVPEAYKSLVPDSVPLTQTVLTPALIIQGLILGVLTVVFVYLMMPKREENIVEISDEFCNEILGNTAQGSAPTIDRKALTPAQKLEYGCLFNFIVGGIGIVWFIRMIAMNGIANLSVNNFNFFMIMLGLVLHKTPHSFTKAVAASVGSAAGIIIQFPLYAGIYGIVNYTGLTGVIAQGFMAISTAKTFPAIIYVYSAILNFFVPSAGSKFIIEIPYIIPTAIDLKASIPAVINAYSFGDYATNLIQPFWALPVLSVFKLKFKDIIAYGLMMCIIASVVTLFFCLFIYT